MGGGHEMARFLREQEPGRGSRHAKAAGNPIIATGDSGGNALALRLAPFAATLDPAALAALGLVAARLWEVVQ
jgi:hypothetical protein